MKTINQIKALKVQLILGIVTILILFFILLFHLPWWLFVTIVVTEICSFSVFLPDIFGKKDIWDTEYSISNACVLYVAMGFFIVFLVSCLHVVFVFSLITSFCLVIILVLLSVLPSLFSARSEYIANKMTWQDIRGMFGDIFGIKIIPKFRIQQVKQNNDIAKAKNTDLKGWKSNYPKILRFFFGMGAILFILAVVIKYASIMTGILIYAWVFEKISGVVLNPYLAKTMAVCVALIVWYLFVHFLFSSNKSRREIGLVVCALLLAVHSLGLYFYTEEKVVDPVSGQVIKYCLNDKISGELHTFDGPYFDEFGVQAHVCNLAEITRFVTLKRKLGGYENSEQEVKNSLKRKEVIIQGLKIFFISMVVSFCLILLCFLSMLSWKWKLIKLNRLSFGRALTSFFIVTVCSFIVFLLLDYFFPNGLNIIVSILFFVIIVGYWWKRWLNKYDLTWLD